MSNFRNLFGYKWFYGGSQNKLIQYIETSKSTKIVVKMVYEETHLWTIMEPEELRTLVKKHNSFISEVLHKYPKKLYLDVECKDFYEGFKDFDYKEILEDIKKYIPDAQFAISGSVEEIKKSYHITIYNYVVYNSKELENFKNLITLISKDHVSIDTSVYTSNRVMKCIYQTKDKKRAPQNIIEDQNENHHFIGSFFSNNEKPFNGIKLPDELTTRHLDIIKVIREFKQSSKEITRTYSTIENIEQFIREFQLEPEKLINYMPPLVDHSITWKVFLFCWKYQIPFETFWNWASKKDASLSRLQKWTNYWQQEASTGKHKEYYISKIGMLKTLSFFYSDLVGIEKEMDIYSNHFKGSFRLSIKPTIIQSISQEHLNTPHKVVIFNIGMGGGKTTNAIEYIKDKDKFYWITPRVALAANTYGSMKRANINNVIYYKEIPTKQKYFVMNQTDKLIIQAESLHYLDKIKESVVIIDEIETVLNGFTCATHNDRGTLKDLRKKNFTIFLNILRKATKIILIDAFTTSKTIDLIKSILEEKFDEQIILYESPYKPKEKQIIHYDEKNTSVNEVLEYIHKDLKNNKKVFIFYPFKNPNKYNQSINDIYKYLSVEHPDKKIAVPITGDSTLEEKMKLVDANTYWKQYDVVLVNGSITVGVNFDIVNHFDKIYMFVSSRCNLPRDIIQASMRIRQTTQAELVMFTFIQRDKYTFETNEYYDSKEDAVYNKMFDEVKYEYFARWLDSIKFFCKLTNYKFPDEPTPVDEVNGRLAKTVVNEYKVDYPYHAIESSDNLPKQVDTCNYEELLKYKKYYFDIKFEGLLIEQREQLWNMRLEEPYDKLKMPILHMINNDNNIDDIRSLNWEKIKVSNETNEYLTKHFNCTLKYPIQRIVKTLNDVMGINFVSKKMKSKNTYYKLTDTAIFLLDVKDTKKEYDKKRMESKQPLPMEIQL